MGGGEDKIRGEISISTFSVGATYAGRGRIWEEHEGRLKGSSLGRASGKEGSRDYTFGM